MSHSSGTSGDGRRSDRSRARPDHPTARTGGAVPAHSALTLRLVLAVFGLVVCVAGAIWTSAVDGPIWLVLVLVVLAVVAVIDLVVIIRRKRRGDPG